MCDTFVALANATRDGSVIFGKNSDREPNEAHELVLIPRATHDSSAQVKMTYVSIPQVRETNAVLLSKPFWIWGAEMGANEHGVVIGNQAVFTKVPYQKGPGLIGMDFLRLALERTSTAEDAMNVIIQLLEEYGQGGNCGFATQFFYHNGFLIADRQEAWVLETAGKHWAAEKVRDVRSISNVISIGSTWDRASKDLVDFAVSKGWCKGRDDFDFGRCYSDFIYTTFSDGRSRLCRTGELLRNNIGKIDVPLAIRFLRDHGPDADQDWTPAKGLTGAEVCMHAGFGPVRVSQATGSMVSRLSPDGDTHWLTGTSAPCTSIFKPVWMDGGIPDVGPTLTGTYDELTLWWNHENLHREILRDYAGRIQVLASERDQLEKEFFETAWDGAGLSARRKKEITEACFKEAQQAEARWLEKVRTKPIEHRQPYLYRSAWKKFDKDAQRG